MLEENPKRTCSECLVLTTARALPAPQVTRTTRSSLVGDWAGIYTIAKESIPIRLQAQLHDGRLKATLDLIPQEFELPLTALRIIQNGFTAKLERPAGNVALSGHIHGRVITGTVRKKGQIGTLQLVRLAPKAFQVLRSYEGIYQAGAETFLVERLYEYLMSFVEVQSGDVRILFPVGENEFVAGPTFLAAQPTEWQITFAMNGAGDATSLQAVQGGKRREARQFVLHREDVIFHNGDVTLAGALISPVGRGPHPALVFTHGSGPATRQSYFGLGFLLASQGIAALMYDKRGSGDSTGNLTRFTYTDLADDAVAGARFLQSRREIDPARIGFWGISEGAWTAPLAASRLPGTAFVIAASGGGLSPAEGELLDSEDQLHTDGRFSDVDIAEALAFQRARDRYMRTKEGWEEYAAALNKAVERPWYSYPTTDLFGPERPGDPEWHNKALYYFYDPAPALKSLRCPFLGIAGALDTPAATERSMAAMRSALTSGGDKYFTLRVLSQANHDFFETTTTGNTEKLNGVKVFSPEFFPLITDWVRKAALDKK